jgi:hypothetical protein
MVRRAPKNGREVELHVENLHREEAVVQRLWAGLGQHEQVEEVVAAVVVVVVGVVPHLWFWWRLF